MKPYTVTIRFWGLTGEYENRVDVNAKTANSAVKKASKVIGNRDARVISVVPKVWP